MKYQNSQGQGSALQIHIFPKQDLWLNGGTGEKGVISLLLVARNDLSRF